MPATTQPDTNKARRNRTKHAAYMRRWTAANRDRVLAQRRARRERYQETVREYNRQYREAHRDERNACMRAWHAAHAEHSRAYRTAWNTANPDKVRAHEAAWRERNREQINARNRARAEQWPRLATVWPFTSAADLDPITATINAAVPRQLPEDIRQEVCQDLAVHLLTAGELTAETVSAAIRAVWKRYPLIAGHERSLDAPMPGRDRDRRERWIDMLPDPACIAALTEAGATTYATR